MTAAALVGRGAELDDIRTALGRNRDRVRAVQLIGDPGIGKSALLAAVVAREHPAATLRAALSAPESDLSWAGLALLLDGVPADAWTALPDHHVAALERAIGRTDGPATDPSAVTFALDALMVVLLERGPVVLAIDDLHWLDQPTAAAVSFVTRRRAASPLTVLVAHRDEPVPVDLARTVATDALTTVRLGGLPASALGQLIRRTCGITLPRPTLLQLHEHTGGSPLYAIEIARQLAAGAPLEESLAPLSLASAIERRLAAVPASVRDVLEAAAVGAPATAAVLAGALERPVGDDVLAAEDAQLLRVTGSLIGFVHPLHRAAVLGRMGELRRRQLHGRFAAVVTDPELASLHAGEAADGPDIVAAAALVAAAAAARERGAWEVAATRATRALALTPDDAPERWERTLATAQAWVDIGDPANALACSEWALEHSEGPEALRRAAHLRTVNLAHLGRMQEAVAVLHSALVALEGHPEAQLSLYPNLIRAQFFYDLRGAAADHTRYRQLAAAAGDEEAVETAAAAGEQLALFAGEPTDVDALVARAAACDAATQPYLATSIAEQLSMHDRHEEAERLERATMDGYAARGELSGVAISLLVLAQVYLRSGRWDDAAAALGEALEINQGHGGGDESPDELADLATLAAARGDASLAAEYLDRQASGSVPPTPLRLHLRAVARGFAALAVRDYPAAAEQYREAAAVAEGMGLHDARALPFRADGVEALIGAGAVDEAAAMADQQHALAARAPEPRPLAEAAWALGMVAAAKGELERAQAAFDDALVHWTTVDVPFHRARTLLAAGACDRRAGLRTRARQRIEEALAEFSWLGAQPWVERAREELTRLGGRGPADELTATEAQVAALVADGRTNAEVASALFMSPKTVEHHLTRIFRKLGLRSRTELAARLGRQPR